MIKPRDVFDWRSRWFAVPMALAVWMFFLVIPWLWPGENYRYNVNAYRAVDDRSRVLVTGELLISRPCVGSTVTSWYEGADHESIPAVRTGHLEHAMVGKSTVTMDVATPSTVPLVVEYQPPEWATAIRWQLRLKPECVGAERGMVEVGYVEIPKQ